MNLTSNEGGIFTYHLPFVYNKGIYFAVVYKKGEIIGQSKFIN